MTVTFQLTPEQEVLLQQEAARRGENPADFVRELVVRTLSPGPSLSELLAPFRQQVLESGIIDGELEDLIEEARREVFDDRRTPTQ